MGELLFAFDMGTTGAKAGILTPDGNLLGRAYREYPSLYPGPQWIEQSIEAMWEGQCCVSREVLALTGIDPQDVAAVAISAQRGTFVPVDRNEHPLTNFIGWQDKRSIAQCEEIKRMVGEKHYYDIAGLPAEPTAAVSKIMWLRENMPEVFEKTHKFYATENIHLHQLGVDNAPCDLPDASYIGLLDVDRFAWSEELLDRLGIPAETMPALVPSCTHVGCVSKAAAEATGLAEGTPLVTAGGDLQVGSLGVGLTRPGMVSLGIGTGGGIVFFLESPIRHPDMAMGCLAHSVPGSWEMEGICLASGGAHKWYRDVLCQGEKEAAAQYGIDAFDLMSLEAAQAPAGAHGVIFMPSLAGAGAPFWYPKAKGVFIGLTLATEKKDLSRAVMEGICFELRNVFESAEKVGTRISEVRHWGGASKSSLWNHIAADIYGLPVVKTRVADTGLVGAAVCAGAGVGIFKNAHEGALAMVRPIEQCDPDPKAHARYNEMFGIYKDAYLALTKAGVFEKMAVLS